MIRFWSPFHRYSLEMISSQPENLIFRAPDHIRLQLTVDHLERNQNPGSCFIQYRHETCLWECYHSPSTIGHHRLSLSVLNIDGDDEWLIAGRFDVHVKESTQQAMLYPLTTDLFNRLRCQIIRPMNGIIARRSLPMELIIRVPGVRDAQLLIDEQTSIVGALTQNDLYRFQVPRSIPHPTRNIVLMGVRLNQSYYSILMTYKMNETT